MKNKQIINVTRTYLPSLKSYSKYLKKIWDNNWITNHGKLSLELERKLKSHLGVRNLILVSNGTVALEIAIKALDLRGEIITTPFSYVATTSSIVWVGCKPVFVDIDPDTLNINPGLIEKAITSKTSAILATHVYGNPCDLEKINSIAKRYKLKVIYDAAHCFGVKYKGKSILNYGDISAISFHATKPFHTAEGGAVITGSRSLAHKCSYLRNFGHKGQEAFWGLGINGKMSELHSAMGLCNLPNVNKLIKARKRISGLYDRLLIHESSLIRRPVLREETERNFSYYPVIFTSESDLLRVKKVLNGNDIFPRRYFFPSLDKLKYIPRYKTPIASTISKRILCLPLYAELGSSEVKRISKIILENL